MLATSLRESLEEMRLNPLGVRFLGPLPSQSVARFHRVIYPMVGWITCQRRFFPNWEVEKIVRIPLRRLLDPAHYACYRLNFQIQESADVWEGPQDYPCFVHQTHEEYEVLWGATYRIVTVFLDLIFGFQPPHLTSLPVVHGSLDDSYYEGAA